MGGLYEKIKKYSSCNMLRMHMPGHKGNTTSAPWMNTDASFDITEITSFDNLHEANGILKNSMEQASQLWHSRQSFYLVNGSTCGILAGIRTLTKRGAKVICARNCHMSVFHAIELCGLNPCFILPNNTDGAFAGAISEKSVRAAIAENPDATAVIITSPTYEGIISDIEAIAQAAHENGMALLVDEAHGAHLDLSPFFTGGAVRGGADITVQSLHKTLPCPTQTAVLHIAGDNVDTQRLMHQLAVFETSSPSYLFLASIDSFVHSNINQLLSAWSNAVDYFYTSVKVKKLQLSPTLFEGVRYDKSKIVISTANTSISGFELARLLREEYNTEIEMACAAHVLAMTGAGDTKESLLRFARILNKLDEKLVYKKEKQQGFQFHCPKLSLPSEKALEEERIFIKTENSVGAICGEYVWAYPPGIPLLIPGERITQEAVSVITTGKSNLHSSSKALPGKILCVKKCMDV